MLLPTDLGVFLSNSPIRSIGDTLGLTSLVKEIYNKTGYKSTISTFLPEIFENNPYIKKTYTGSTAELKLTPCTQYKCNIIQHYFSQVNLPVPKKIVPEIYLNEDEIAYAKVHLQKYKGNKIIAVCLNSSASSRDLKYLNILPLLEKLKKEGYILISVGKSTQPQDIYHESFINITTLRQVFSLINECNFYLGVDTGLFHVSAALNVPQVVFFRHNQCSNNAYYNTYYLDSLTQCPSLCQTPGYASHCALPNSSCMDTFNFDEYYNLIINKFPI